MENKEKPHPPVEIPYQSLTDESLGGIIENFLQREGTDYGAVEITAEAKSRQLENQIRSGHTKIIFDPNTETVTLVTKEFWKKKSLDLDSP